MKQLKRVEEMKEDKFFKIAAIFTILQLVCMGFYFSTTKYFVEKHSVHPIYGNYKKHDSKGRTCEPWDSCK